MTTCLPLVPTTSELLWLWRKRNKLSVAAAARQLSVTRAVYLSAEQRCDFIKIDHPTVEPTAAELLRLCRRRSYVSRDDLAVALGVSHVTFLRWEREVDQRIVNLWID